MKFGYLSQVFTTFAWKQLTSVEVDPMASNGHEFNSSSKIREILGTTARKCKSGTGIPTRFFYLSDEDEEATEASASMSWYDSRANHATRNEWRLYYTDNAVIGREGRARAGDCLIIAFTPDNKEATVLVAKLGSTCESQLLWLFGINFSEQRFTTAQVKAGQVVDMTRARILEAAGVVIPASDDLLLGRMLKLFDNDFPSSAVFGAFVRNELTGVRAEEGADSAIIDWMEHEEFAYRVLEKFFVKERLNQGFNNVEEFMGFSLSVHNRRKSRAGRAFENHLGEVFRAHGLTFERSVTVEDKGKPDFIFPSATQYFDNSFPVELLTLLGAKTSCKDRWRQILVESSRVKDKHLVTLEPAISTGQLEQMRRYNLQVVIPASLHATYPNHERAKLWDIATFITAVSEKQKLAIRCRH
jgi:hypothetical protein